MTVTMNKKNTYHHHNVISKHPERMIYTPIALMNASSCIEDIERIILAHLPYNLTY